MAVSGSSVLDAVDPSTLLSLAQLLATRPEPAALRSAGDRAYYAAFLTARDQLFAKNYAPLFRGGSAHFRVIEALRDIDAVASDLINDLRATRNRITYTTEQVILTDGRSIQWMLEASATVIRLVNDLPTLA